jgi:DNA invertase Pin-like site-specific DNA recombinase
MRAVAYTRVSGREQADSGLGLEAQTHTCTQGAAREGGVLVGPFADAAVSGAAPLDRRPALLDALAQLAAGDVLLVAKRDRLGRDPIAVAMVEAAARRGCRVVSAAGEGTSDDAPGSVLMRRMIDPFSGAPAAARPAPWGGAPASGRTGACRPRRPGRAAR